MAVFGLAELLTQTVQLLYIYPTLAPSYLFDAGYPKALTVLNGGHEVAGLQQAVAVSGVEPGKTSTEQFYLQRAFFQIEAVQVGEAAFSVTVLS